MVKIYFFVKKKKTSGNWSLHSSEHRDYSNFPQLLDLRGFIRGPKSHQVASTQIWHHFTSVPHFAIAEVWMLIRELGWLFRNRSEQGDGPKWTHSSIGVSKVYIAICNGSGGNQLIGFFYLILLIWGIFSMNLNVSNILFYVNSLFFYPTRYQGWCVWEPFVSIL